MEIERKFKIKKVPDNLTSYPQKIIEQGYIATSPVIRIRKANDDHYLTVKGKGLIEREEFEMTIERSQYYHLKTKLEWPMIQKTRYLIPYQTYMIELDVFHGHLEGLIMAEVEFDTRDAADAFLPPEWFGADISLDSRYHNSYLCRLTNLDTLE